MHTQTPLDDRLLVLRRLDKTPAGQRAGARAAMLRLLGERERDLVEREVVILKLERWMRQIDRA